MTLRETIAQYKTAGTAIAHFNFSDSNQLRAIAEASKATSLPIIAGLSEGEREYFPLIHARGIIDAYRAQGVQIFLNADHTYSLEKVREAIAAGVDSVVVDGAKLSFEENIALVKESVALARASGRDVVVEAELGYIGQSSKILDSLPEGVTLENLTTAQEATSFSAATGIDCFAPAIGNIHGILKNAPEPKLHADRVKEIAAATGLPLVLHGASGNSEAEILECIASGIAVVHINTELRVLYRNTLQKVLADKPDEVAPYKFLTPVVEAMRIYIEGKLKVFAKVA